MQPKNKMAGVRIGISGKGGAGKSTLTVFLAQEMARQGYQVCVLDADSSNLGLALALGMTAPKRSLLNHFGDMVFRGGKVTCPVDDPSLLESAEVNLADLSADFYSQNEQGVMLFTAGKIGSLGPGAGCDGPVAKISRDFSLRLSGQEPVTLIDFKAGFEDSARGVLASLDYIVVVVDPTVASVELAAEMRKMVQDIITDSLPATSHLENEELVALANRLYVESPLKGVFFVLNRIPDTGTETYLRKRLNHYHLRPIAVFPDDSNIRSSWLKGESLQAGKSRQEAQKIIAALEKAQGELA
jgi:CO dehydrogenase maturation factor